MRFKAGDLIQYRDKEACAIVLEADIVRQYVKSYFFLTLTVGDYPIRSYSSWDLANEI